MSVHEILELTPAAHAWAAQRQAPILLIDIDPAVGLTQEIVATVAAFTEMV